MRTHAVAMWTAAAATVAVTAGGAFLLFFQDFLVPDDAGRTEVGGVSVTAPAETEIAARSNRRDPDADRFSTRPAASSEAAEAETADDVAAAADVPDEATAVSSTGSTRSLQQGQPGNTAPRGGSSLEVKGSVTGLYPGRTKYLPLVFENKNNFAVDIVDMAATATSAAPCDSGNLEVPQAWTPRRIAANAEQTVNVPVRLRSTAGTECAGVVFSLAYNGKAVKA